MDSFGNTSFSGLSKRLINRLASKEITKDEFLKECAYWAIKDGFDEIKPLQFPTAPAKVNEYEILDPEKRARLDQKFFLDFPEIMTYYTQVKYVLNHNRAQLDWLKDLQKWIPADDLPVQAKIEARINEFVASLDNPMLDKAMEIFNAKKTTEQYIPKQREPQSFGQVYAGRY